MLLTSWYHVKLRITNPFSIVKGDTFPELHKDPGSVMEIINEEETQFLKTLRRGHVLFDKAVKALAPGSSTLHGNIAWRLYDTYGFPIDLTQLMAEERGLAVQMEEYEESRKRAIVKILIEIL